MSTTRSSSSTRRETVGGLLVGLSALLFGIVVLLGKFARRHGLSVEAMLSIRFGLAALLLAAALVALRRPLFAEPGERLGLALLALLGYAVEATFFFTALGHGTVAAVTLLFFTYPVLVTLGTWAIGRVAPARQTLLSLGCALVGSVIVVGTGAGLQIETLGVVLALSSAITFSCYLVGADAVLRRTNALTSAMWVSAGASIGLFLYANAIGHWRLPAGSNEWFLLLGMGLASAAAFVCLMEGIQRIGAVRTAIVSALEPLAAATLAWLFLGEVVTWGIAIGGTLILVAAVTASLARSATPQEQQIP
ncbi:MAG: DMT family transporter [Actinomycetota bacterium]